MEEFVPNLRPENEDLEASLQRIMLLMQKANAGTEDYRALSDVLSPLVIGYMHEAYLWPILAQRSFTNTPHFTNDGGYLKWCETSEVAARHRDVIKEINDSVVGPNLIADIKASNDGGVSFVDQMISRPDAKLVADLLEHVPSSPEIASGLVREYLYAPEIRPLASKIFAHSPPELGVNPIILADYPDDAAGLETKKEILDMFVVRMLSLGHKVGRLLPALDVPTLESLKVKGFDFTNPKLLENYLKSYTSFDDLRDYFPKDVVAFLIARCPPSAKAKWLAKNRGIYYQHFATDEEISELFSRCGVVRNSFSNEDYFLQSLIKARFFMEDRPVEVDFLRMLRAADPILFELCGALGEPSQELILANDGCPLPSWRPRFFDNIQEFRKSQIDYVYKRASLRECQNILFEAILPYNDAVKEAARKKFGKLLAWFA
jgi:hypothetical protein